SSGLTRPEKALAGGSAARHREVVKQKAPASGAFVLWREWRVPDLNRGHRDFQSRALPTELTRRGSGTVGARPRRFNPQPGPPGASCRVPLPCRTAVEGAHMSQTSRYLLAADEIPREWYNLASDLPSVPPPPLN